MKKSFILLISGLLISALLSAQTPKYIFYFIGDGMGSNQVFMTSTYNTLLGGKPVNFESFPCIRLISTVAANALVTDSSAAGTALATGSKTNNSRLGTDPEGKVLTTVAELAKQKGLATGVVSNVSVNHATPACFYAHVDSRSDYDNIARQLFSSQIDFAAGESFLCKKGTKVEELIAEAKQAGITVYEGKGAYKPTQNRIIYLESPKYGRTVSFAIDREEGEIALADFTSAAIDHLYSASRKGFFLMVEGGQIDHGCHSRDAANTIGEINDMAESVQLALDFAAKHPKETLIIVTADHETGGCTLGSGRYESHMENIRYQKCSKDLLTEKLYNLIEKEEIVSWSSVKAVLSEELGFWTNVNVSKDEEKRLTQLYKETFLDGSREEEKNLYSSNSKLATEAVEYLTRNISNIIWPLNSHTAAPVRLFVYGPKAMEFISCNDNTDVPKLISRVAGFN